MARIELDEAPITLRMLISAFLFWTEKAARPNNPKAPMPIANMEKAVMTLLNFSSAL